MRLTRDRNRSPLEQWSCLVLIALLSAGLWFGWFGWDTEYRIDPITGRMTGPYEVWQGVAAFLCGFVVVGLAHRLLRFVVAVLVLPLSFTLAWTSTASAVDSSGLWVVGAILVAVGSTLGAGIMLGVAAGVEVRANKRRTNHRGRLMPDMQHRLVSGSSVTGRRRLTVARTITEVLAPAVLVGGLLLLQPLLTPGVTWLQSVTAAVFTVGLPFALILVLRHRGAVTDHHVSVREQRAPILVAAAVSLGLGALLLMLLAAPAALFGEVGGVFIGLVLCLVANLVWKLSVHAAVAAYVALALLLPIPTAGPALALVLVAAVGWSRVTLRAHTPSQVIAGYAAGWLAFTAALLLP